MQKFENLNSHNRTITKYNISIDFFILAEYNDFVLINVQNFIKIHKALLVH